MATTTKQYDCTGYETSIGCIDERPATMLQWRWGPDGGRAVVVLKDARRRMVVRPEYERPVSRPSRWWTPKADAEPELTMTQRAVRDYRRAWASIHASKS